MASTPSSLMRPAVSADVGFWRTASIHSAPVIPVAVPPAASMAGRTAAYPGWVKLSTVSVSNTGPASAGYCSADLSASRWAHRVGSRGSGRAAAGSPGDGAAGCWAAPRGAADAESPRTDDLDLLAS